MPTITEDEFLLTTEDYHRMAEAGILDEDDRVELIDGKIVPMTAIGSAHLNCVNTLNYFFVRGVPDDIEVSIQNPVQLGPHQEPEPDVALLQRNRDLTRVPRAGDVLLLIEVADTTYRKDREVKLPRYARAGIPQVWIVHLEENGIEVYTNPSAEHYAEEAVYQANDTVTLPYTDQSVEVSTLLL